MIGGLVWNQYTALSLFTLLGIGCALEAYFLLTEKLEIKIPAQQAIMVFTCSILGILFFTFYRQYLWLLPSFFVAGAIAMFGMAQSIQEKLKATLLYVFVLAYGFLPFYVISILLAARYNAFMVNMVLFFFILIWVNDTFAYIWGRLLGKHAFAPLVSPKKTWEGFIGGVVSTAVFALFVCPLFLPNLLSLGKTFLILSAIVVSVVGTVGDLFESSLKRWVGVKDSGNIIPGHGGLLDRFDGVLFAVWTYLGVMLFYLN